MNSRNDMILPDRAPSAAASATSMPRRSGARRWSRRRGVAGFFAALAVVGFAAAMVAPTGVALADPAAPDENETVYSLALEDTQNLTVTVEGATIAPVQRGSFSVYVTPKPTPTPTPEPAADESTGGGGPLFYTGGGAPAEWMTAAGIAASDQGYVDYIVSKESGWNPNAVNTSSGASGLVQALPCSKVPGNCFDPVDNLRWANGYATGRYGSWAGAYDFWTRNHWW
ncbi:transglycosylase SLT domain-containing protein [Microbacterium aurantiacum]|uniref:aggregation-promoting factor C-terminal-like domain-containing protein n=1 Tax=Microbacterium aurantiacum TaxID=162393 RepID=UPI001FE77229|nr:transglycosylase SLT domain-containing protein [Microbacterium aurantiacum]